MDWAVSAPENLPKLKAKFHHVLRPAARLTEVASSVGNLATDTTSIPPQSVEVKDNHVASTVFNWTGSLLAGAGETIALVFLLLASGDLFLQKLVRVIPRLRDKKQAVEVCREIQQSISTYLLSVGMVNLGFGAVVGLTLHLLGMPNATMWGGVAMFANFIPYLGPIVGIAAVALGGLLAFDTLPRGLLPASAYFLLHLIEANAVTPFVLGRRFTLNPVVIFVALIFCAWLWGIIGALLAVPLLVTVKLICDRVPALALISEFLASQEPSDPTTEAKSSPPPRQLEIAADAATRVPWLP
jgi:predicted PurR-regulated permease PerM